MELSRATIATSAPTPVPMFRFSTEDFPARERLDAWREVFGRTVVSLDIDPPDPDGFKSEATICRLPGLGVLFAASAAVSLRHSRELIVDDDLSFMAAPSCKWAASQLGRNPMLDPGQGILMTNGEVGSMALAADSHFITFRVPQAAIAPLVPDLGAAIARPIPSDNPALRLLVAFLEISRDTEALATPELQRLAATHVHDLLAVALGATREAG